MNEPPADPRPQREIRPIQPRFSLSMLFLIMFVVSVLCSAGFYLYQSLQYTNARLAFVLFTVAAPILVMIALSVARGLVVRGTTKRRRR